MFSHQIYVIVDHYCFQLPYTITEYILYIFFSVIKVDKFTRMLWDIYTTVREEGLSQVGNNPKAYKSRHEISNTVAF